ncbi:MAG: hypothetical protein KF861_21695, partial [Planctomycetaceae bacterium]|nr:hypothetical protein [Planctomycetaceae bacterium]
MAYPLFLLANFLLFVRPGEIAPALQGVPWYQALLGATILASLQPLQNQFSRRALFQQPTNLCVLGVVAGVALSHLSLMYFYGLRTGVVAVAKVAVYYFLLVSLVTTPRRMRQFLMCTAVAASVMIGFSVRDFLQFVNDWDGNPTLSEALEHDAYLALGEQPILRHVVEQHTSEVTASGDVVTVFRMRGLGMFADPNDVSLLIVVTSIICVYFLTDRSLRTTR